MPNNTTSHENSIWISAGEASGDMHGALLMKGLGTIDPNLKFTGMGGPAMEEAGAELSYGMDQINLVGGTEILSALPRIVRLLGRIKRKLASTRPRAVVLIDCPEFNFRIAKIAHKLDIPVYYYISPQIWAWRSGRVKFLKKHVRKMLCIIPFEKDFYRTKGMDADYVGSPLLDQLPLDELDRITPDPGRIGVLPGSRSKEISTLLPEFAKAAGMLRDHGLIEKVTLIRAPGVSREKLMDQWPDDLPVEVIDSRDRYPAMKSCRMLMAASGTVTFESALIGVPTIIAYKLSPLSFAIAKRIVNVKYIGLANLILDKPVFPELIQDDANARTIRNTAEKWLVNEKAEQEVHSDLARLRGMVGEPGAAGRAAKIILKDLNGQD